MRTLVALVAILAVGTSTTVVAQQAEVSPEQPARLTTTLSSQDLENVFPVAPRTRGVSGDVRLDCIVHLDHSATCAVVSQAPDGMGFGDAALRLAQNWSFLPAQRQGQPIADAHKGIHLVFANEQSTPLPLESGFIVAADNSDDAPPRILRPDNDIIVSAQLFAYPGPRHPPPTPGSERLRSVATVGLNSDYPEAARRQHIEGRAIVACTARANATMECALDREAPGGWGFGDTALKLVRDRIGAGVTAVRIPVDFRLVTSSAADANLAVPQIAWVRAVQTRIYPARALERDVSGTALMVCIIRADAQLACSVADENPRGMGFGQAAAGLNSLRLAAPDELQRQALIGAEPFAFRVRFEIIH